MPGIFNSPFGLVKAMPADKKGRKRIAAGARKLVDIDLGRSDKIRNSRERLEFLEGKTAAPVGQQEYDRIIAELDELRRKWR